MVRFPVRVPVGFGALLLLVTSATYFTPRATAGCSDTSVTCLAGRIDNFATADGAEPTAPSAALQSAMASGCPGVVTEFDRVAFNQCLGHSFAGCWPVGCAAGATLTFHARGGSDRPDTDVFALEEDATPIYTISFNALRAWQTAGADMTWSPGDDATFVLELGNLPPGTSGGPDIRASLQDGDLDVLIQDDTMIDYLQLYVRVNATPAQASTWGQVKSTYR